MPMPMENRAAQFAPFAALSGHDAALAETARLTDSRLELTDEEKRHVSRLLNKAFKNRSNITVTYFIKDKLKQGGEYHSLSGMILKIDEFSKTIILEDGGQIPMEDILSVHII